jgi:DNA-binding MarR family transcriptional regulator
MAMLSMSSQRTRRMKEVAALANGSLTRLSRTVDRLEARGWVTRRPDPEDGRSTLAVLTDAGWDKVVATAPGHVAEVRRLVFDPLTATQVRHLREIATRIREVVQPEGCLPILPTPDTR